MPRTKGAKNKKPIIKKVVKTQSQKQSQTVHVHVERPKARKKRTSKPKEPSSIPLSKPSIMPSVGSGFTHTRGQINNEQPTIIQQIQAPPDPRIDKLEKRSLKIKAYLKGNKGESKPILLMLNHHYFKMHLQHYVMNALFLKKLLNQKKLILKKLILIHLKNQKINILY